MRSLAYLSIANRKLDDLASLREETKQLLDLSQSFGEYTYHGIGLANQGWLAWRDGNILQAADLCKEANEICNKFGGCVFHGLANWVLLAIAVSQGNLAWAESCAQSLSDPNPSFQPLEKPAADLLSQAITAGKDENGRAAFALFNQAIEVAKANHDFVNLYSSETLFKRHLNINECNDHNKTGNNLF